MQAVDINDIYKNFTEACEDYESSGEYRYFEIAEFYKNQITDLEIQMAIISKKKQ